MTPEDAGKATESHALTVRMRRQVPSVHRASVRTIGFVPRHCRKCQALAGASHASPSKGRQGGQAGQGTDPAGPPAGAGRAPDGAEGTPISLCCHAGLPNLALSQSKAERLGGLIGGDEDAAEQVTVLQMRLQSCRGEAEATGGTCPAVGQRAASSALASSSVLGDPYSPNLLVLV